jgi:methylisocitrate lyase
MGAHDVLSAQIVERTGYEAIYISSLPNSFINGVPDIAVVGPEDLVALCRRVRRATSIPIIVDFEQGFGEPYAAVYWMRELAAAGVAAIHIDDYGLPYKCTFLPPYKMGLEPIDATAERIRALVGEKPDPDFLVIARPGTYVATVYDSEEERRVDWLSRAKAYSDAGADVLYAICWSVEHAKWFRSQVSLPLMTIRTLGTETNADRLQQYGSDIMSLSIDDLFELGYDIYVEPTTLVGVAANAMLEAAQRVRASGRSDTASEAHGSLYDHLDRWMDVPELRRIQAAYVRES